MHTIAAKAVAFGEALQPEFQDYAKNIVANAARLAEELQKRGFQLITNGTSNHLILADINKSFGIDGKTAEIAKFIADKKFKRDRRVLLVVDEKTPELIRATNNLQSALLVRAQYLSVYYVLNADQIIMTPAAVKVVDAWLNPKEDK